MFILHILHLALGISEVKKIDDDLKRNIHSGAGNDRGTSYKNEYAGGGIPYSTHDAALALFSLEVVAFSSVEGSHFAVSI